MFKIELICSKGNEYKSQRLESEIQWKTGCHTPLKAETQGATKLINIAQDDTVTPYKTI